MFYRSAIEFFCGTSLVTKIKADFRNKLCRKAGVAPANVGVDMFQPHAQYVVASLVVYGKANVDKFLHWFWDDEQTLGKGHSNEMLKFRPIKKGYERKMIKGNMKRLESTIDKDFSDGFEFEVIPKRKSLVGRPIGIFYTPFQDLHDGDLMKIYMDIKGNQVKLSDNRRTFSHELVRFDDKTAHRLLQSFADTKPVPQASFNSMLEQIRRYNGIHMTSDGDLYTIDQMSKVPGRLHYLIGTMLRYDSLLNLRFNER